MDILIKNARLRDRPDDRVDIAVEGGLIQAVEPGIQTQAHHTLDAGGNLVTESFINPHLHLDKVYTLERLDELAMRDYHGASMGKAMTAIELASRVKAEYDEAWILPNVRRALRQAVRHGTTHLRAFADVDTKAKLVGVKALLKAKAEFQGILDLQVVAFPQDGVVREPGAAELVEQAMELGADLVGGIPWIEFTDADAEEHIRQMLAIAKAHGAGVSMLVDDAGDAGLRTLESLAVQAIAAGWEGKVLAHHARAMALYAKPYFQKLAALLKRAGMAVVTDPHTGPLHARVRELLEEGVTVCLGQDDISDAYYPYGRNSMLEVAFLASHMLWMTTAAEMEVLYDMITVSAARAIGLEDFRLTPGSAAHLVILDTPSVLEALRAHAPPLYVISHGKLVDPSALPGD